MKIPKAYIDAYLGMIMGTDMVGGVLGGKVREAWDLFCLFVCIASFECSINQYI